MMRENFPGACDRGAMKSRIEKVGMATAARRLLNPDIEIVDEDLKTVLDDELQAS